ncbi:MAG: condensation domain-containing protein, partial [Acidobacteriota bacterium]
MTHADTTTETVAELVAALQKRGVRLHADGDRLRFKAPRGALTPALKERLSARKHEVLAHLRGDASPASAEMAMPAISSHPDDRFEPFPLTDLQQAYWLGHQKLFELGNVSAHAYTEYDLRGLDMERLEKAWNRLISRHEMLRCVVGEDGRQRILETVPFYSIPIEDLRDLDEDERQRKLLAERDQMCKYGPTPDTWPLFEMRGFRIGDDHYRVHWSSSLLVVDDWSFHVLNVEWFQMYHKLEAELPSFELSFRDYVLALRDFESSPAYARSLDYWRSRIATLPPAPDLPLAKDPAEIETPWFQRRSRRLSGDEWGRFKDLAKKAGVTPSAAICAVYSEALAAFSKDRHFTLNMLFFNRLPIHPEIDALVGNTSSTLLFEVDCRGRVPFGERAKQLQEQLWKDLKHNLVSGVRVLRELAQSQHSAVQTVPVVFASNINAGFSDDDITQSGVGSIYNHMQTSHVWLDHQIFELPGRVLHYNWDAVQGLFPDGLVDRMFDAYGRLLDRLSDAEAWTRPIGDLLAEDERRLRSEVNATTWESGVATRCLHELVFDRARRT